MTAFDARRHIAATAPALGLTIAPAWEAGVAGFLTLAHGMAERLMAAPLADDALEPAPVFRPGPPDGN